MPRLDLYINYELQAAFQLEKPEVLIGRDPTCDVQLPDTRVSRVHAAILTDESGHRIEDRSANGVRVNGQKVESSQPLNPEDTLFISRFILIYQTDGAPSAPNLEGSTVHEE